MTAHNPQAYGQLLSKGAHNCEPAAIVASLEKEVAQRSCDGGLICERAVHLSVESNAKCLLSVSTKQYNIHKFHCAAATK